MFENSLLLWGRAGDGVLLHYKPINPSTNKLSTVQPFNHSTKKRINEKTKKA
jgi:hypothetical protein